MTIYRSVKSRRLLGIEWRDDGSYKALILNTWFWTIWVWKKGSED